MKVWERKAYINVKNKDTLVVGYKQFLPTFLLEYIEHKLHF